MRRRRDNELSKALQLSMVEGELASEPGPAFKKVKKAYRPLGVGIKTADADEDVGPFATNKPTSSISTMCVLLCMYACVCVYMYVYMCVCVCVCVCLCVWTVPRNISPSQD
jgi:hypothetical protein